MPRWILAVAATLALATLSFGCRRHVDPVHDARRIERFERNLIRIAARDSRCAPVQVQPARVAEVVWTANTCNGPFDYHLDCRSRSRRWANCRWRRIPTVPEAAQSVLMCPPQAIQQQPTAQPLVRNAAGCGRSVQMTMACNDVGCGWIASSQPTGAPAAPAGQQTTPPNTVVIVPAQ